MCNKCNIHETQTSVISYYDGEWCGSRSISDSLKESLCNDNLDWIWYLVKNSPFENKTTAFIMFSQVSMTLNYHHIVSFAEFLHCHDNHDITQVQEGIDCTLQYRTVHYPSHSQRDHCIAKYTPCGVRSVQCQQTQQQAVLSSTLSEGGEARGDLCWRKLSDEFTFHHSQN